MGNFFDDLNDAANLAAANNWWNNLSKPLQKCLISNLHNNGNSYKTKDFFEALSLNDIGIWGDDIDDAQIKQLSQISFTKITINCLHLTTIKLKATIAVIYGNNNWKKIQIDELKNLQMQNSSVSKLDFSNFAKLETLDLSGCKNLTTLNLSGCTSLITLKLLNCTSLTNLDLSGYLSSKVPILPPPNSNFSIRCIKDSDLWKHLDKEGYKLIE